MQTKRLYWDIAVSGGAAGVHALGQGTASSEVAYTQFLINKIVNTTGDPAAVATVGTVADPALTPITFSPGDYLMGLNSLGLVGSAFPTVNSPWAVTVTGGDFTGGLIEFVLIACRA